MKMLWLLGKQIVKAVNILIDGDVDYDDDIDDDDFDDDDFDDDDIDDDDIDDDDFDDDDFDDDDFDDDDVDNDDIDDDDADDDVSDEGPISFTGRGDTPRSLTSKIDSEERHIKAIEQRIRSGLAKGHNMSSEAGSLKIAQDNLRRLRKELDDLLG